MPIKGKQIVDRTVTQKQLGVTTDSINSNDDVTTKKYVDDLVNNAITGLTYTDIDYNLSANETTGSAIALATDTPISKIPVGGVRVYVNGIEVNVGPGLMSFFAPENTGTPTPREFEQEQQGDYLWWDPVVAKYQLEVGDDIDFVYRTYKEDYPSQPPQGTDGGGTPNPTFNIDFSFKYNDDVSSDDEYVTGDVSIYLVSDPSTPLQTLTYSSDVFDDTTKLSSTKTFTNLDTSNDYTIKTTNASYHYEDTSSITLQNKTWSETTGSESGSNWETSDLSYTSSNLNVIFAADEYIQATVTVQFYYDKTSGPISGEYATGTVNIYESSDTVNPVATITFTENDGGSFDSNGYSSVSDPVVVDSSKSYIIDGDDVVYNDSSDTEIDITNYQWDETTGGSNGHTDWIANGSTGNGIPGSQGTITVLFSADENT